MLTWFPCEYMLKLITVLNWKQNLRNITCNHGCIIFFFLNLNINCSHIVFSNPHPHSFTRTMCLEKVALWIKNYMYVVLFTVYIQFEFTADTRPVWKLRTPLLRKFLVTIPHWNPVLLLCFFLLPFVDNKYLNRV